MPRYYEFEVSLQELQPRIWRRFLLRTTATFAQLHQAIQQERAKLIPRVGGLWFLNKYIRQAFSGM